MNEPPLICRPVTNTGSNFQLNPADVGQHLRYLKALGQECSRPEREPRRSIGKCYKTVNLLK